MGASSERKVWTRVPTLPTCVSVRRGRALDEEGWRGQGRILPYLYVFNAYIIEHNAV